MEFFKRKRTIITGYQKQDVDGAEVWMVSWDSLIRKSIEFDLFNTKRVSKAFLTEEDAKIFAESIYDALIILQFAKDKCEAKRFSQLRIEKQL